ncbi:MAG: DUF2130 domain-containing protein [Bacilli bacterium]|nr:DUF2130 domain-containing protein [Bacilli bacterium]
MNEIKCPKCGTVFQISESDYESIVKQIRDHEFESELLERENRFKKDIESAVKLAESSKDMEIQELKLKLSSLEEQTKNKLEKEYENEINKKELEISELKGKLQVQESKMELEIQKVVSEKEKKIDNLSSELELKNKESEIRENSLKEQYELKLKDKDEQIAYYKDFKAKQSTKMIGESLEQHCSVEFNRLRPLFKNSYFEKDNDAKTGSKGDFIFRDFDEDGNEIVSIMFEMKNEADSTATKHKNEHFFKELDKDRKEKNCEYAVLVSLLEPDNDYYNDGIVDVSHLYDKMYVIRPQFFIPLITLIRNLASKSLEYRKELELVKNQNIDITHFEENINLFKEGFGRNYRLASERFQKAIEEIDKTIDHLQKTKEHLLKTDDNLRLANNKAEDLTIKKLTRNNPTMQRMFDELEEKKEEDTIED